MTATLGDKTITHQRFSITKALPVVKILLADGWDVSISCMGDEKRVAPPPKPQPMTHPWKAGPAVVRFARKRRA